MGLNIRNSVEIGFILLSSFRENGTDAIHQFHDSIRWKLQPRVTKYIIYCKEASFNKETHALDKTFVGSLGNRNCFEAEMS